MVSVKMQLFWKATYHMQLINRRTKSHALPTMKCTTKQLPRTFEFQDKMLAMGIYKEIDKRIRQTFVLGSQVNSSGGNSEANQSPVYPNNIKEI